MAQEIDIILEKAIDSGQFLGVSYVAVDNKGMLSTHPMPHLRDLLYLPSTHL
jgi:hypothetical protein